MEYKTISKEELKKLRSHLKDTKKAWENPVPVDTEKLESELQESAERIERTKKEWQKRELENLRKAYGK